MAGGDLSTVDDAQAQDYSASLTPAVIFTCLMAASGGLIYGYAIGISGGLTEMESFLNSFFPEVGRKMVDNKQDVYCAFNSQLLTAYTSSLYIAGLFGSFGAGCLTRAVGRQMIMLLGGTAFFIGSVTGAASTSIETLFLGRVFLGIGVGFIIQATPLYIAETAPAKWRGAFTTGFEFSIGIGVLTANVVNYATARINGWGWRLSLGLANVPASLIILTAFLIPDTPSSLLERGLVDQARAALIRIRGATAPAVHVETELNAVARSIEESRAREEGAFRRILLRRYRPYLVMAVAIPVFQKLTGIVVPAFFGPEILQTAGFSVDSALLVTVLLGGVTLGSNVVSMFAVDRYGRKFLFMIGGAQMFIAQVAEACILGAKLRFYSGGSSATLPQSYSQAMLALMCWFSAAFGGSWGPLSRIVPSEIFPVEVRSVAQSICVAVELAFTFAQTQTFLATLCSFKQFIFVYFAAWVAVMTVFVAALLPETKGVHLESMTALWEHHWYWRRFYRDERGEQT